MYDTVNVNKPVLNKLLKINEHVQLKTIEYYAVALRVLNSKILIKNLQELDVKWIDIDNP